MNVQELETVIAKLPPMELEQFSQWFEGFIADRWDRQIETDVAAGRLDAAGARADRDFDSGLCKPL